MKRKWTGTVILAAVLVMTTGCQIMVGGRNAAVSPGNRIPIKADGPYSGIYNDNNLILDYTYRLEGGDMTLTGSIEFLDGIPNFGYMKHFHMQIYFLDAQGMVLDQARVFSAGFMREIDIWQFRRRIRMPAGAAAMAFGYAGTAQSAGGPDEITWDFWHTPA